MFIFIICYILFTPIVIPYYGLVIFQKKPRKKGFSYILGYNMYKKEKQTIRGVEVIEINPTRSRRIRKTCQKIKFFLIYYLHFRFS